MTAHEALWTLKVQLQKTPQNMEAIKVLEGLVKNIHRVHIDDYGTEEQHMLNHMNKVAQKDIQELEERNLCQQYEWAEDDEIVKFYDLCDTEKEK